MERLRIECNPSERCPYYETGGRMDTHHLWHPRKDYKTRVEKQFRSLPFNLVEMCRCEHEELHATQLPPPKPPIGFMRSEIERAKGL